MYAEDKSKSVELQFEKHELYNRRIVAHCLDGHELYQQLICGRLLSTRRRRLRLVTFRVAEAKCTVHVYWSRPSVCLSVPHITPALLHEPGCN